MSANNLLRRMLSPCRDDSGAVAVEFGLIGSIFIVLLLATIDLGQAFWQFSQASKALQLGVRLAAVSDPVSSDLKTMTGISGTVEEGDPMPYFKRVCSGATQSCSGGTYDAVAMRTILFGRGNSACPTTPQAYPAMCQIFPRVQPRNLVVEYTQTGLGFAGRPGGPVPTITVRLTDLSFNFAVLNGLLGFPAIPMARLTATVSGEDLSGR